MRNKVLTIAVIICILLSFIAYHLYAELREQKMINKELQLDKEHSQRRERILDTIPFLIRKDNVVDTTKITIYERRQSRTITGSTIPQTYADSLAKALKIGTSEIERLTKVNAKLQGELSKKNITIENLKENEIRWKNRYIDVVTNLTDSTINYTYNADISVVDYQKREKWYKAKKHYTALTSSDPNFRINGVQRYEKLIEVKCPSVKFGVQSGYGAVYIDNNFRLAPYVGVGINFNLFR
ncbi:hypothetical protein [Ornithobacterium rhinotracheale]|uniref:hypothetical protein n=1 Tax=Ornithobacterium rhinotracheale TaxID=28251 RepID=UPI001FF5E64F|nr:hypothetical protein [Ornithobacterium rhinotracheale]MCK0201368.1 hypothetical protein [Ornithobacterium rhinotracheale]